jgi:hypothetical protein
MVCPFTSLGSCSARPSRGSHNPRLRARVMCALFVQARRGAPLRLTISAALRRPLLRGVTLAGPFRLWPRRALRQPHLAVLLTVRPAPVALCFYGYCGAGSLAVSLSAPRREPLMRAIGQRLKRRTTCIARNSRLFGRQARGTYLLIRAMVVPPSHWIG